MMVLRGLPAAVGAPVGPRDDPQLPQAVDGLTCPYPLRIPCSIPAPHVTHRLGVRLLPTALHSLVAFGAPGLPASLARPFPRLGPGFLHVVPVVPSAGRAGLLPILLVQGGWPSSQLLQVLLVVLPALGAEALLTLRVAPPPAAPQIELHQVLPHAAPAARLLQRVVRVGRPVDGLRLRHAHAAAVSCPRRIPTLAPRRRMRAEVRRHPPPHRQRKAAALIHPCASGHDEFLLVVSWTFRAGGSAGASPSHPRCLCRRGLRAPRLPTSDRSALVPSVSLRACPPLPLRLGHFA